MSLDDSERMYHAIVVEDLKQTLSEMAFCALNLLESFDKAQSVINKNRFILGACVQGYYEKLYADKLKESNKLTIENIGK